MGEFRRWLLFLTGTDYLTLTPDIPSALSFFDGGIKKESPAIARDSEYSGAVSRIRTGDPILTMDVLYLLS